MVVHVKIKGYEMQSVKYNTKFKMLLKLNKSKEVCQHYIYTLSFSVMFCLVNIFPLKILNWYNQHTKQTKQKIIISFMYIENRTDPPT